ncbi:MAG: DNA polymerase III subunit beta [Flavobacteriaceae bacterium]|nr:DNA polymerase III subunit beta [Flavobacteriaceae bacterium]MCY4267517.1 DNA polymerase III subunit beta [Flavobacteriaceae bacterium]MCY4299703.1 DNA polymerase III subunit beta [Flavobacteriaceae bacterium]
MEFLVNSQTLVDELTNLIGVVHTTNSLPILNNVLFELDNNRLQLTTSDLETTLSSVIQVESKEKAVFCLPARMLYDALKTFHPQPLTFSKNDKQITFVSKKGRFQLVSAPGYDYPKPLEIPKPESIKIPVDLLNKGLHNTLFAVGPPELRKVLTGVFFHFDRDRTNLVSTDGHKLVCFGLNSVTHQESVEFIVPKRTLSLLKNILMVSEGEVNIEYNKTNVRFSVDSSVVTCKLIDGKFPNYKNVFPPESDLPNVLTIDRLLFKSLIDRSVHFASRTGSEVSLKLEGSSMVINAKNTDYNHSSVESINCDYNGDDLDITFNARFLSEMLKTLDTQFVQLKMGLPTSISILIPFIEEDKQQQDHQIEMLIMPTR